MNKKDEVSHSSINHSSFTIGDKSSERISEWHNKSSIALFQQGNKKFLNKKNFKEYNKDCWKNHRRYETWFFLNILWAAGEFFSK